MPKKGDIVLVSFPFTDLSGEKLRPALVVGISSEQCITLFVTSRIRGEKRWHVLSKATDGTGLAVDSVIRCDKIASFDTRIIRGKIGRASKNSLRKVDAKLRTLLKL